MRQAYSHDVRHFRDSGGTVRGLLSCLSDKEALAAPLDSLIPEGGCLANGTILSPASYNFYISTARLDLSGPQLPHPKIGAGLVTG